jgi:hypothetical protein
MARTATDDLDLLATRLRLGIPLEGFDGRPIPLRHPDGEEVDPVEAARQLLDSAAALLPPVESVPFVERALGRARDIDAACLIGGESAALATARVAGVLVSAAVRASILARAAHASPADLNRATLAWYEVHDQHHRQLRDANALLEATRLTA